MKKLLIFLLFTPLLGAMENHKKEVDPDYARKYPKISERYQNNEISSENFEMLYNEFLQSKEQQAIMEPIQNEEIKKLIFENTNDETIISYGLYKNKSISDLGREEKINFIQEGLDWTQWANLNRNARFIKFVSWSNDKGKRFPNNDKHKMWNDYAVLAVQLICGFEIHLPDAKVGRLLRHFENYIGAEERQNIISFFKNRGLQGIVEKYSKYKKVIDIQGE